MRLVGVVAASGLLRSPWSPLSSHLRGAGAGASLGQRLNHLNVLRRSPPLLSARVPGVRSRTSSAAPTTTTTTPSTAAGTLRTASAFNPTVTAATAINAETNIDNGNNDTNDFAPATATTLLVGSQKDAASQAMVDALLSRGDWVETTPGVEPNGEQNGKAWSHALSRTSLWSVEGSLLGLDDADLRWASVGLDLPVGELEEGEQAGPAGQQHQRRGERGGGDLVPGAEWARRAGRAFPSDVVFLSKHVAKSGVPALCVHPIGVPDVRGRGREGGEG